MMAVAAHTQDTRRPHPRTPRQRTHPRALVDGPRRGRLPAHDWVIEVLPFEGGPARAIKSHQFDHGGLIQHLACACEDLCEAGGGAGARTRARNEHRDGPRTRHVHVNVFLSRSTGCVDALAGLRDPQCLPEVPSPPLTSAPTRARLSQRVPSIASTCAHTRLTTSAPPAVPVPQPNPQRTNTPRVAG